MPFQLLDVESPVEGGCAADAASTASDAGQSETQLLGRRNGRRGSPRGRGCKRPPPAAIVAFVVLASGTVACARWPPRSVLKALSAGASGAALMAGFEGHTIPGDPAALFAGDRPVESLEEICEYVRGEPGADNCPDGLKPLSEAECRDMPFIYGGAYNGGAPRAPLVAREASDSASCHFIRGEYRFRAALEAQDKAESVPYCKHCEIVSLDEVADWTTWNPETAPKVSSRYRKLSVGTCQDVGWAAVSSPSACQEAVRELGLGWEESGDDDAEMPAEVQTTMVAERPEGCYQFTNYEDKSDTTWFNVNPYSKGFGAETGEPRAGLLRQPVCQRAQMGDDDLDVWSEFYPEARDLRDFEDVEEETTTTVTTTLPPQRFRRLLKGNCTAAGGRALAGVGVCEAAAKDLGLPKFTAATQSKPDRPEGCYLERNLEDTSATLWFNADPAAAGKGTEASEGGMSRSPICEVS